MGCLGVEGFLGTTIPVPCGVIHRIVHTQNNGPNYPQFLISDPWNKGQFGYTTIIFVNRMNMKQQVVSDIMS